MEQLPDSFARGDRVVILRHRTKKFVDEPGTIVAFAGRELREYAVVAVAGQQVLVRIEDLESEA